MSSQKANKKKENKSDPTRFAGDGINFRGKFIGVSEVSDSRGDKMCQETMQKLKAAVKSSGEHKQRISVNVSMEGIKLIDEKTEEPKKREEKRERKKELQLVVAGQYVCDMPPRTKLFVSASVAFISSSTSTKVHGFKQPHVVERAINFQHPVHRISFISRDISDSRAFGYVFGVGDGTHKFFAIKTEKSSDQVVLSLRDLFQTIYKMKKKEMDEAKRLQEDNAEGNEGNCASAAGADITEATTANAAATPGTEKKEGIYQVPTNGAPVEGTETKLSQAEHIYLVPPNNRPIEKKETANLLDLENELETIQQGMQSMGNVLATFDNSGAIQPAPDSPDPWGQFTTSPQPNSPQGIATGMVQTPSTVNTIGGSMFGPQPAPFLGPAPNMAAAFQIAGSQQFSHNSQVPLPSGSVLPVTADPFGDDPFTILASPAANQAASTFPSTVRLPGQVGTRVQSPFSGGAFPQRQPFGAQAIGGVNVLATPPANMGAAFNARLHQGLSPSPVSVGSNAFSDILVPSSSCGPVTGEPKTAQGTAMVKPNPNDPFGDLCSIGNRQPFRSSKELFSAVVVKKNLNELRTQGATSPISVGGGSSNSLGFSTNSPFQASETSSTSNSPSNLAVSESSPVQCADPFGPRSGPISGNLNGSQSEIYSVIPEFPPSTEFNVPAPSHPPPPLPSCAEFNLPSPDRPPPPLPPPPTPDGSFKANSSAPVPPPRPKVNAEIVRLPKPPPPKPRRSFAYSVPVCQGPAYNKQQDSSLLIYASGSSAETFPSVLLGSLSTNCSVTSSTASSVASSTCCCSSTEKGDSETRSNPFGSPDPFSTLTGSDRAKSFGAFSAAGNMENSCSGNQMQSTSGNAATTSSLASCWTAFDERTACGTNESERTISAANGTQWLANDPFTLPRNLAPHIKSQLKEQIMAPSSDPFASFSTIFPASSGTSFSDPFTVPRIGSLPAPKKDTANNDDNFEAFNDWSPSGGQPGTESNVSWHATFEPGGQFILGFGDDDNEKVLWTSSSNTRMLAPPQHPLNISSLNKENE